MTRTVHRRCFVMGLSALLFGGCSTATIRDALPVFEPRPAQPLAAFGFSHEGNNQPLDHSAFDTLLKKIVVVRADGINRIAYARLSIPDRQALDAYIVSLRDVSVSLLNRREQMAFWVNLHNALVIRIIVTFYPVKTIYEAGLDRDEKVIAVEGTPVSLADIRDRVIRAYGKDPRLLYALATGAQSDPAVQPRALTTADWNRSLDGLARAYVNRQDVVRVNDQNQVTLARLYKLDQSDFGGTERAVFGHIRQYATADLRKRLEGLEALYTTHFSGDLNDYSDR